ncbi:unnamed protein product [Hyaloperonospora brassicae]|uniref:RxLR effector candidate protein n=1 Tax=Hyaloperonospora brassicae TaxID=162125 RepID=A0AAV0T8Z3_HYABA|nr:unnamed protein product [Hyaloperonospora brassicae]
MALPPSHTAKRTRPSTSSLAKYASGEHHKSNDVDQLEGLQSADDHQVTDDDQPRRKRPMIAANLRFLEKMPPLRNYQRDVHSGRRGGVDGGDGDSSFWMRALEESMEETSFVTGERPTRAALVAPVPSAMDNQTHHQFVPVPLAVRGAARVGVPAPVSLTTASTMRWSSADDDAIRRRRLFALRAVRGGGKDDEARPATEGFAL